MLSKKDDREMRDVFFLNLHNRHHCIHMWCTMRARCSQVLVRSSL
jgi:hypothetical protein